MVIKRLSCLLNSIALLFLPFVVSAQGAATTPTDFCKKGVHDFTDFLGYLIQCLIAGLITKLIIAVGVIIFMFGVVRFIWKAGDGDTNYGANLAKYLGYSLLAMFIMLSMWGIIFLVGGSLGIGQGGVAPIPTLPTGP